MEESEVKNMISAVVLAGGNSRRMGTNKALIVWKGMTFLERICGVLSKEFSSIYLSGPKEWYKDFSYSCIEDHYPQIGPLGALASIFETITSEWIFVVSCDTPFLTREIIELQVKHISKENVQAVFCNVNGKEMPLVGFYHKSSLKAIQQQIASSNYRIMDFLAQIKCEVIDLPKELIPQLLNVNTKDDLI